MTILDFTVHAVMGIVTTLALRSMSFLHIPAVQPVTWTSGVVFVTTVVESCQNTTVKSSPIFVGLNSSCGVVMVNVRLQVEEDPPRNRRGLVFEATGDQTCVYSLSLGLI